MIINENLLKSPQEIRAALIELSEKINKDFNKEAIDLIAMNHAAKYLVEELTELLEMDVRSQSFNFENYENPVESGEVQITKDLELPIFNRHVILADGILISGNTHFYVCNYLKQRLPKSLSIVCVGDKPKLLAKKIPNCYSLFSFNDEWVEGYGIGISENKDKPYLVDTRR
jgi:hypoxanthine phosphoribosyltransferase